MLKKTLALCALLINSAIFAQQDYTLYHMRSIPQATSLNPALTPKPRAYFGMPLLSSFYFGATNTGFKYNDLIQKNADDSLVVNMDNLITKLEGKNQLFTSSHLDILNFGFRSDKNFFSFNVTEKLNSIFVYPKDLMVIAWEGNGKSLLGQRASLDGLGFDFTHYREYALGYAREINEKLTIGGKVKYLYGMENIYTRESTFGFHTDSTDFAWTIDGSMEVNTSGIDQMNDTAYQFNFAEWAFKRKNHGAGIDAGANYKYSDKLSFSASILDIGVIKWKHNITNFRQDTFNLNFIGLSFQHVIRNPDAAEPFAEEKDQIAEELSDSIDNIFRIDKNNNAYSTWLWPRMNIGASYVLNEKSAAGGLVHGQLVKGKLRPGLTVSYNAHLTRWFSASASYTAQPKSYTNVGAGFSANLWPLQLHLVTDNLLSIFAPHATKNANVRLGLNLTFGRYDRDSDEDGIIDKEDECSDTYGLAQFKGCPDRDGDAIIDKVDNCPDEFGLAITQGCPDKDSDGVMDKMDACPDVPGLAAYNGCPDSDGDGIVDSEDKCPKQPGPPETQGCPDLDKDGIVDIEDLCPDKPGAIGNLGCPETKLYAISEDGKIIATAVRNERGEFIFASLPTDENIIFKIEGEDVDFVFEVKIRDGNRIQTAVKHKGGYFTFEKLKTDEIALNTLEENDVPIKLRKEEEAVVQKAIENLEFSTAKNVIDTTSFAALDEFAALLTANPAWKLKLAGHTDNTGNYTVNMILSKKRAQAVQKYLTEKGISADRFVIQYFGDTKPLATNDTPEGRQKNRRVEMTILQ